jgi:hypothetical protein
MNERVAYLVCPLATDPLAGAVPDGVDRACCSCEARVVATPGSILAADHVICRACWRKRLETACLRTRHAPSCSVSFENATDQHCGGCRQPMGRAWSPYGHSTAKPDDLAICTGCGHISIYGAELKFRSATEEDLRRMRAERPGIYDHMIALARKYVLRDLPPPVSTVSAETKARVTE